MDKLKTEFKEMGIKKKVDGMTGVQFFKENVVEDAEEDVFDVEIDLHELKID